MSVFAPRRPRPLGRVETATVALAHGGGKAMKDLIDDVFVAAFDNPVLAPLDDQARFDLATLAAYGDRLAFTTDSYVVDPLFFPGGDIGMLAVNGTVNDLAVGGAVPLHRLLARLLEAAPDTRFMRDATRGGVATVLNEIARASAVAIEIDERRTPLREPVKGFCEIFGLDPLYLANEGKIVAIVPAAQAENALAALRADPLGRDAAAIGRVEEGEPGRVTMHTALGGRRIVDMLVGEQLPRIC